MKFYKNIHILGDIPVLFISRNYVLMFSHAKTTQNTRRQ